ncbi:Zn(II)2Cys6 transcription factor [Aspergillus affinis]|uniref:Zn(II)2Cys6 transcription factor n=1 Tax=Aspergillus affinis TaxID=1070780 RepID=UPI0022FEA31C|nr:fungal-specific transcription factor domain-containing protein [Aspergillus affinis]KAI9044907.1 fungal-specific transcription factor domain-containing protein [Aspergillus affinis]
MRAACWTCRKRTIQCDRTSDPCAKCKKAGLECFETRPLRWVKGVAIRGKLRGRVLEEDQKVANGKPTMPPKQKSVLSSVAKSLALKSAPPLALQDPCTDDLGWSSRFYLDYYNIRIAKLFILYDSASNPFRNLLAYAVDDSTLRMGIIAVAARHFANSGRSFDQTDDASSPQVVNANVDALHFKRQAIKSLLSSLSHPTPSQKDTIMATILLLIFLDILESGIDGWKYHLHGAEELFKISQSMLEPGTSHHVNSDPGETVEETRRFVARQFSLVSTIGGALSNSESMPGLCVNSEEGRNQESIIRSFLGCPGFLLEAIRYFSNQRHVIETLKMYDDTSIQEHVRDTQTMLELTGEFDCVEWASNSVQSNKSPIVKVHMLSLLSESYRTATFLYGNRVLRAFGKSAGAVASDNGKLVLRLLDVIEALKCDDALFKCLLWPTFIAGLECETESDQQQVVQSLKTLWDLTCCLNIINASKILHDHWRQKQSGGNLTPEESQLYVIEQGWLLV